MAQLTPDAAAKFISEHGVEAYHDRYINADRPETADQHAARVRERIEADETAAALRAKILSELEARMAAAEAAKDEDQQDDDSSEEDDVE